MEQKLLDNLQSAALIRHRWIVERREHLIEAWIAETGLLPSESVLETWEEVVDGVRHYCCRVTRYEDSGVTEENGVETA